MAKIILGLLLFFFVSVNIACAEVLTTPDELIGWHERIEVTDLSTGFLNDSGLGIAQVFLFEIQSGEVSQINVDTDTYTVEININEPSSIKTELTINTTNYDGNFTSTTHDFYHLKIGSLTSPIYVMIGTPPAEWGVHSRGVVAKTYREIDLADITGLTSYTDIPVGFTFGWDEYYDGFLEPPMQFHITSDGPITVRYEVTTIDVIYDRADRSVADFALALLSKIPYVGKPLAMSIEAIGTIMGIFIGVVFFAITGWAILFLLFETFVCAHGIAVMKMSGGGIAGVVGVFGVIASDNYAMIMFVVNLFTTMFTLLIDLVKALREMSPI